MKTVYFSKKALKMGSESAETAELTCQDLCNQETLNIVKHTH